MNFVTFLRVLCGLFFTTEGTEIYTENHKGAFYNTKAAFLNFLAS